MQKKLDDQIALVTGAGRGLGRSIAVALASENATVIIIARTMSQLKETAQQVELAGGKVHFVVADLREEESIKNLIRTTEKKFGKLDILVNNAGITLSAKLEDTDTADWDSVFRVNSRAPFILCKEALPLLSKSNAACIVNIGSVVSVKCYAMQSAYTASKHALRGMTQALAEELRDTNIRVHLLCPGGIDTDMISNIRPDIKKEDLMQTKEIAELVLYLVTHKGNAVIDELHIRRAASPPWF